MTARRRGTATGRVSNDGPPTVAPADDPPAAYPDTPVPDYTEGQFDPNTPAPGYPLSNISSTRGCR